MYINHCSGHVGLKTHTHAAFSWPHGSLPLILMWSFIMSLEILKVLNVKMVLIATKL